MSFLYPQFLFGLLAISVPIIIHLFNFQKPKVVYFTNVRFLKNIKEITNNSLKIKHLLILAARCLFLAFLVLAFAQPFKNGKNASAMGANPSVQFYLDNSYSMQREVQGDKALDAGIKTVSKIKDLYPQNASFYLLTNDFEGKDQYKLNKEKLAERLSEVNYSNISREAPTVITKVKNQILNNPGTNHLFICSDFQKSTIGNLSKINFDTTTQYHLLPMYTPASSNIFIDTAWLKQPLVRAKENNTIEARVFNNSSEPVSDLLLKLYIDNVQSSTANISISPNASQIAKFNINLNDAGNKKCRIAFEDFPVTFDNEYFFVINVSPRLNILHLYKDKSNFIPSVFGNNNIFNLQTQPISDFDYSLIPISDLIVLENLENIPEALHKTLKEFTYKGGSILLFPNAKLNLTSYNSFFQKMNLPLLKEMKGDSSAPKINYTLSPPEAGNPYFEGVFEKKEKNLDMPFARPVVNWSNKGEKLLSYKNGDAFLSFFNINAGKIFLSATPLNVQFTNLPRHATFVPIMYRIAFQSIPTETSLAYNFQSSSIRRRVDVKENKNVFQLVSDNFKIIPQQRLEGRQLIFNLPTDQNFKPGFYELTYNDSVVSTLAFNFSSHESVLENYSQEELKQIFNGKKNVHIYEGEHNQFLDSFKDSNIGTSLWKYCLMLSLLFLLVEVLLIRFY